MNLVDESWIPVVYGNGTLDKVSLMEVFSNGEMIADLDAPPCQRIALMRLLVCIAQAALDGPKDEQDWLDCRGRIVPAAQEYLKRWHDKFELYGDNAFLQVAGLTGKPNATKDKLEFSFSSGNNDTLYDHGANEPRRETSDAELALRLLVFQNFSPGGLIGRHIWDGKETSKTSTHAPCVERSMLFTIVIAENLISSIHSNFITKEQVSRLPQKVYGKPCWETNMSSSELKTMLNTHLARLVPISRIIKIENANSEILLGAGLEYKQLPEAREPWASVVLRNNKLGYVGTSISKQPWRDVASLLSLQAANETEGAMQLNHIRHLSEGAVVKIWTGGLATDKAKILNEMEWSFVIPVSFLESLNLANYQNAVGEAEKGKDRLYSAISSYASFQKAESKIWKTSAEKFYWDILTDSIKNLEAVADNSPDARSEWHGYIKKAMEQAYEKTCPHETARQLEAYVNGLRVIRTFKF